LSHACKHMPACLALLVFAVTHFAIAMQVDCTSMAAKAQSSTWLIISILLTILLALRRRVLTSETLKTMIESVVSKGPGNTTLPLLERTENTRKQQSVATKRPMIERISFQLVSVHSRVLWLVCWIPLAVAIYFLIQVNPDGDCEDWQRLFDVRFLDTKSVFQSDLSLLQRTLMFGGFIVAWYIVCDAMCGSLMVPWIVSKCAIDQCIDRLEETEIDWDDFTDEVHVLNKHLDDLWSFSIVTVQWLGTISACLMSAVLDAFMFLQTSSVHVWTAALWSVLFFQSALAAANWIMILACITYRCEGKAAGAKTIFAAARRYPTHGNSEVRMSETQRAAHTRFLFYMTTSQMGVHLCGLHVTAQWATKQAMQLLVVVPTVLKAMQWLQRQDAKQSMPAPGLAQRMIPGILKSTNGSSLDL